jgi:hypothetical protein
MPHVAMTTIGLSLVLPPIMWGIERTLVRRGALAAAEPHAGEPVAS